MEIYKYDIPVESRSDFIYLACIGDEHTASVMCETEMLKNDIAWCYRNKAYILLMGDGAEFISQRDIKRWDIRCLDRSYREHVSDLATYSIDRYCALYDGVRKQIIGKIKGNHEEEYHKHYDKDVQMAICKELDIKNLGYSALIGLSFKRSKFATKNMKIFAEHGTGAGRKEGAKINRLIDKTSSYNGFDLFVSGHTHSDIHKTLPITRLSDTCTYGYQTKIVYSYTGTYYNQHKLISKGEREAVMKYDKMTEEEVLSREKYETIDSYAERASFAGCSIGMKVFKIYPFNCKTIDNKNIDTGLDIKVYEDKR